MAKLSSLCTQYQPANPLDTLTDPRCLIIYVYRRKFNKPLKSDDPHRENLYHDDHPRHHHHHHHHPPSTPKRRFAQVRRMVEELKHSVDALKKSSDAKYGPSILKSIKPIAQLVILEPVECTVYGCTEIGHIKHPAFAGSMCAKHAEAAAVDMMFRCAADFCNEVLPCSTRTHKQVNLPCRSRPCSRNRRRIQKQPNSVIRFCGDHRALQHLHRQCRYHPYRIKAPGKSTCTQCVQEGRVTAI